jgi:hypothetical protein
MIVQDLGYRYFYNKELSKEENVAKYARILFLIGQFNTALNMLLDAQFLVETCLFGIALSEIGVLMTQ